MNCKRNQLELLEALDTNKVRRIRKMVDATRAMESEYLNVDMVKDAMGDGREPITVKIVDSGEWVKTDYGDRLQLKIAFNGIEKKYKPNMMSAKEIGAMHGTNTHNWVGKELIMTVVNYKGKDCISATPKVVDADKVSHKMTIPELKLIG